MYKIYFFILLFTFLTNCAAPGTALLSPVITGAKTKSAHQASLSLASSLSSNKFIREHTAEIKVIRKDALTKTKKIINKIKKNNAD